LLPAARGVDVVAGAFAAVAFAAVARTGVDAFAAAGSFAAAGGLTAAAVKAADLPPDRVTVPRLGGVLRTASLRT
jgi:hypothetical protein